MSGFWNKTKEFFGFQDETQVNESFTKQEIKSPLKPFKTPNISQSHNRAFPVSEIKVEEPRVYEDSLSLATHLREEKPVIVKLKYLDTESGKRLIDFLCGTAYAINGHMMKIGENIFLFTPSNILITENTEKTAFQHGVEQEEKEVFFRRLSNDS